MYHRGRTYIESDRMTSSAPMDSAEGEFLNKYDLLDLIPGFDSQFRNQFQLELIPLGTGYTIKK